MHILDTKALIYLHSRTYLHSRRYILGTKALIYLHSRIYLRSRRFRLDSYVLVLSNIINNKYIYMCVCI